jgi:hypothetical protein
LRVCVFEKPTKTRREIKRIKKERKKMEREQKSGRGYKRERKRELESVIRKKLLELRKRCINRRGRENIFKRAGS